MNRRNLNPSALAVAIGLALFATGCAEPVVDAPQPGDNVDVPGFEWRVRDADTLAAQYQAAGKDPGPAQAVDGFIARDADTGAVAIYTEPPRHVDDAVACTLGHEVMHAALGDYHAKREAR